MTNEEIGQNSSLTKTNVGQQCQITHTLAKEDQIKDETGQTSPRSTENLINIRIPKCEIGRTAPKLNVQTNGFWTNQGQTLGQSWSKAILIIDELDQILILTKIGQTAPTVKLNLVKPPQF